MNDHILPFKSPRTSRFNVEAVCLWYFTVTEQRNSKIGAVLKCFGGDITVVVTADGGQVLCSPQILTVLASVLFEAGSLLSS